MTSKLSGNRLVKHMAKDYMLLTLKVDLQTLAEFSVAAKLWGARSNSTFMNQYVVQKIREAKGLVSEDEFKELVEKQKEEILNRSLQKSLERKNKEGNEDSVKAEMPKDESLDFSGETKKITAEREEMLRQEILERMKRYDELKKMNKE